MSNVARVYVKGWIPFDVASHNDACKWLGILNGPSYGLRITYGQQGGGPRNRNGGVTTYYQFEVSGEEAIWCSGVESLVKALVGAGSVVEEARMMDLEYDPNNMEWGKVQIPRHRRVRITPGSPMMRHLASLPH